MHPPIRLFLSLSVLLASGVQLPGETELDKASRLLGTGDVKAAQMLVEQALKADPRNPDALYQLGRIQLREGKGKQAMESADKAIALLPTRADYHALRGNSLGNQASSGSIFKAMGLARDGLAALEKAVQMEPGNLYARGSLFSWYLNVPGLGGGGVDKALAFADQTLPLHPAQGHLWKAHVFQKRKDFGAVQRECRLAIAADPRFAPAYNLMGYAELEMKQLDFALADFRKLVELAPEAANSHDSLGDGLMAKDRVREAIQAYRQGLELNPRFWECAAHLGTALERAGQREEAISHYRHYVQLGSQSGNPRVATQARECLKRLGIQDQPR